MTQILVLILLLAQATAPAPPPQVPDDLAAYVRTLSDQMKADRAKGQRAISLSAGQLEKREVTGENLLYSGLIMARGFRQKKAAENLKAYLAGRPANRELGLAALIEASSWTDMDYKLARKTYAVYLREFGSSTTSDPLKGTGARLRLAVEESMARVCSLDGEDNKGAAEHYAKALEVGALVPGSLSTEDLFRLRWYRADAMAETGKLDQAIKYLLATRPMVKSDPKSALQLEDRIVFKQTEKFLEQKRAADARAMLEKRLPEFQSDPILTRRVTKLLDRVKLVSTPAPEFTPGKWIGGEPLTLAGLRGKVVLLEFLTSG